MPIQTIFALAVLCLLMAGAFRLKRYLKRYPAKPPLVSNPSTPPK